MEATFVRLESLTYCLTPISLFGSGYAGLGDSPEKSPITNYGVKKVVQPAGRKASYTTQQVACC